jgi:hypothetical protein
MKPSRRHSGTLELINDILSARARMAEAGNQLKLADAYAQAVKRERKDNRPAVRSAQRRVTLAKKEFMQARTGLAKTEEKYMAVLQQTAAKRKATPARLATRMSKETTKPLGFRPTSAAITRLLKKQHSSIRLQRC